MVVQVFAAIERPEDADGKSLLFVGTGFYISKEGHILTNASICYSADRIWVEHDGQPYLAHAVGHDLATNLSILQVEKPPADLSYVPLINEAEPVTVGTFALAITRQVGLPPSPAFGLITGRNIQFGNRMLPTTYLRTDIPSLTGENGSPIFDLKGRLIGIMNASLPEIRSSFILPTAAIRRIRDDILYYGEVQYAWFGLNATPVRHADGKSFVLLEGVMPDSPASGIGLKAGDHIVKIGNYPIHDHQDLRDAVFFTPPEQNISIAVERDGKIIEVPMKAGRRLIPDPELPEDRRAAAQEAAIPGQQIQLMQPVVPDATSLPKQEELPAEGKKEDANTAEEEVSQATKPGKEHTPIKPDPLDENQIEKAEAK